MKLLFCIVRFLEDLTAKPCLIKINILQILFYSFSNIRKFIFNFPPLRVFFFFSIFNSFYHLPLPHLQRDPLPLLVHIWSLLVCVLVLQGLVGLPRVKDGHGLAGRLAVKLLDKVERKTVVAVQSST